MAGASALPDAARLSDSGLYAVVLSSVVRLNVGATVARSFAVLSAVMLTITERLRSHSDWRIVVSGNTSMTEPGATRGSVVHSLYEPQFPSWPAISPASLP